MNAEHRPAKTPDPRTRTRHGERQFRLVCSRCSCVRWWPLSMVGVPHCIGGQFLIARESARRPRLFVQKG